jgi:hypothetical protein
LATTQKSISERMVKQTVVHLHHGILFSNKKAKLEIHVTTWTNLQGIMLSLKALKGCMLFWFYLWDSLIEMKNGLVIARGRARATQYSWWRCVACDLVPQFQDVTTETREEGAGGSLGTVSYEYTWIWNYLKMKILIFRNNLYLRNVLVFISGFFLRFPLMTFLYIPLKILAGLFILKT